MTENPFDTADLSDLDFAADLADIADQITLSYYGRPNLGVAQKADLTPVSEADRLVELKLRERIAEVMPGDLILGEEFGVVGSLGEEFGVVGVERKANTPSNTGGTYRQWIIDPIDGTKNFIRGVPVWATLIALVVGAGSNRKVMVGVVSAPALGRRWRAGVGHGAWSERLGSTSNGDAKPLRVSKIDTLSEASLSYSSLTGWGALGLQDKFLQLALACGRSRAYGDFWSYMLLAEGAVDIATEPELEVYDMAALVPIVTEAGGTFTSLSGQPGPWGGNALATNGLLKDVVQQRLSQPSKFIA